jgi:PIN domain nuclease of toxin-antitoxin system
MLNLDTHILIYLLKGDLNSDEIALIGGTQLGISSIVLWEMAKLHQLGRIAYGPMEPRVVDFLSYAMVWPIDGQIAFTSTQLDFRSDPADEIIAATSVVHRVPLLTRDARLRSSSLVPLALR